EQCLAAIPPAWISAARTTEEELMSAPQPRRSVPGGLRPFPPRGPTTAPRTRASGDSSAPTSRTSSLQARASSPPGTSAATDAASDSLDLSIGKVCCEPDRDDDCGAETREKGGQALITHAVLRFIPSSE